MGVEYAAGLLPVVAKVPAEQPFGDPLRFSPEDIISLEMLRMHTKTDDIMSVTDEQLRLYRTFGVEAAEQYTGLLLSEQRTEIEVIRLPRNYSHDMRREFSHRTQYPVATADVYVFGPGINAQTGYINVTPGTRKIYMPNMFFSSDFSPCCAGHNTPDGGLFKLMYRAGFESPAKIPAGIRLGIAKLVAWEIAHPGDVMTTVDDRTKVQTGIIQGTNNSVWASGALELWKQYVKD